ncbi:hypothetical protein Droror1_Dr00020298, partial [Drosera rotundifolia]
SLHRSRFVSIYEASAEAEVLKQQDQPLNKILQEPRNRSIISVGGRGPFEKALSADWADMVDIPEIGYVIPAGWKVLPIFTAAHLDPSLHHDPSHFDPSRWNAFQVMGYCVCVAKGVVETLKFNMALIRLPVCRTTLTKLKSTWLGKLVTFDDNINFHKTIVAGIVLGTFVHVIRLLFAPQQLARVMG